MAFVLERVEIGEPTFQRNPFRFEGGKAMSERGDLVIKVGREGCQAAWPFRRFLVVGPAAISVAVTD
ncbi:MAG: hypothetical protein P4M00_23445 [Azospirillaceae bacterium]|nr:hypothetical protein [Azospirillaceae bacterium]